MFQNSFLALAQNKKLRCERFLDEMEKVIPWGKMVGKILPHYEQAEIGRKKKEAMLMLKPPLNFEMHHLGEVISPLWHIHTSQTQNV